MQKIPTLFTRNPTTPRLVTRERTPDTLWVLNGEGTATRKYDGTCCLIHGGHLYRRHVHKSDKGEPPLGWIHWDFDPDQLSGTGWLKCTAGAPADRYHNEAFTRISDPPDGTYELVGPKVQRNPEHFEEHTLVRHGVERYSDEPRTFDGLKNWLADKDIEGLVWHHPDGRMAKIKKRDFGLPRIPT